MSKRLRNGWWHLDFFQFEARLLVNVPREAGTRCGKTHQVHGPGASSGSGFTTLFEALALTLCPVMPVRLAASMLRCADKPLWRRIDVDVREARARDDMNAVGIVGIDETSPQTRPPDLHTAHQKRGIHQSGAGVLRRAIPGTGTARAPEAGPQDGNENCIGGDGSKKNINKIRWLNSVSQERPRCLEGQDKNSSSTSSPRRSTVPVLRQPKWR